MLRLPSSPRLTGALLALALASAFPASADPARPSSGQADAPAKRLVAIYVEGSNAAEVRDEIAATLPEGVTVADDKAWRSAVAKEGQKLPVGATWAFPNPRKAALVRFAKAAADVGADGVIVAFVSSKAGAGEQARVLYLKAGQSDATEKSVPHDASFKAGVKSALDLDVEFPPPHPSSKQEAHEPQAVEPPAPSADKKEDDKPSAPSSKRPPNTHGREILDTFVGFDLGGRFFGYHDGLSSNLRDYKVFGAPGIALAAGIYPLATLDVPVVQNIGIIGDFRIAPGFGSKTADGTRVPTSWNRFDVGLRLRQPLAKQVKKGDKAVVLGVRGSVGRDAFVLTTTGALAAETPSVQYLFLRVGLDGTFPAGPLLLSLQGGYLGALSAGAVYSRFRNPRIGGIDIGGGVTLPIALGFEARLTGEYIRWFYAFGPVPGDPYVAGGALDQYVHLEIGPAYVF